MDGMTSSTIFGVSLAAGYLLGTTAGRERYEQLAAATRGLVDDVGLQSAAGALSGRASELVNDARRRLG
jgi:hypothetical protein